MTDGDDGIVAGTRHISVVDIRGLSAWEVEKRLQEDYEGIGEEYHLDQMEIADGYVYLRYRKLWIGL